MNTHRYISQLQVLHPLAAWTMAPAALSGSFSLQGTWATSDLLDQLVQVLGQVVPSLGSALCLPWSLLPSEHGAPEHNHLGCLHRAHPGCHQQPREHPESPRRVPVLRHGSHLCSQVL